ncbi:hypothetical protein ILYODFUR_008684 [Ilyodon furcidens]|uniref:Uncharacterized protein n=1 Tax=Ilyodon furcidens TaxID=33524 RepID=A0ABV0USZ9_9TELE
MPAAPARPSKGDKHGWLGTHTVAPSRLASPSTKVKPYPNHRHTLPCKDPPASQKIKPLRKSAPLRKKRPTTSKPKNICPTPIHQPEVALRENPHRSPQKA